MDIRLRRGLGYFAAFVPLAYVSCLFGVTVHEVLGHGLAAILAGGTFHDFSIHWDAMGYAFTELPSNPSALTVILHLAAGTIATTVIGLPLLAWGLLLPSRRRHKLPLIVVGSLIALDGLPYLFFNSLIPRLPGDFGRMLTFWLAEELPVYSLARWTLVLVGGIGTLATIFVTVHAVHLVLVDRLSGCDRPALGESCAILAVFVLLPSVVLCYMFDWNQLIVHIGRLPGHVLLLMVLASVGLTLFLRRSTWSSSLLDRSTGRRPWRP